MMEPTLRAELNKALVSTSQNDSGSVKSEKDGAESSANQKYIFKYESLVTLQETLPICIICSSNTKEISYDIYTTFTGSSKCLLFDFITKTSNIMFERDKVWSNSLCRDCYMLVNVLDRAEEKFLTLKNEFLVILNKNNNVTALCKRYIACQTQTDCVIPSKIEFCAINVKDEDLEFDDLSRGASPLPVSDSDDEPLAKNKDKAREEVFVPVKMSPPIKCEVEIPVEEIKCEVFVCIKCKLEFKNKALGAVHAFTVHRIDIAKEPEVLVIKGCEEPKKGAKESKKRKSKKKAKRKSYADLEISDIEDFDNDIDWSGEKKHKSKGRTSGKVLKRPIFIKPHEESPEIKDIKPTTRELQKKLCSSSLIIKKVHQLAKPIKILSLDKNMVKKGLSIKGRKSKMSVESANDMLERLQCVGLEVKMNLDHDKRKDKKLKETLTCTECAATFSSKARLDYHMVKHAGSNSPYICEICGASYKHKKACDIHVGMHKGISPWKCSVCEKIFPSKGALSRHEAIHTGTPNYQCDLCGKSFIHTSSFKMHKLSHSGVKPHSCSKCGLALMTRSHLKRHQRVHSGEKRHECQTCGKKFSERYNLYAHQKSHDPSGVTVQRQMKNHDCTVCDATFNRRYILEKHMETAHQRVADTGPKRPRNTMTKLLKQQAMHQQPSQSNQSQDSQASVMEMIDVKIVQPAPLTPPIAHNTDSTSSTLIGESSFQHSSGSGNAGGSNSNPAVQPQSQAQSSLVTNCPIPLIAKEELPDPPPPSLAWQGLYQLANDYPLRMHGVDYMGYLGRQ